MTHILIPREPSTALLRPFIECPTPELDQAWAAMVRIAEVQHARDGRSCLAQIEEPATLAGTTIEQYARMFNAACEALGQVSDCLGINSDIEPGAEPIIAAIEQLRAGKTHPVLDDRWKARMLDGRAIERDEMGLGDHPELPMLDEGMMPRSFFAALGLELAHTSAEDQLDWDVLGAMSEAVNWTDWLPTPPQGDGWKLVSIFDTEDGPVAWWLRELPEAEDGTTTIRILQAEVEKLKARIARRAGAAPAAVAPKDVVAWMHPETLNVISASHKHDMSTEYGAETRRKAESHSVALVRAEQPATAAPALEAPAAGAPQGEYPHEQMDAMALARYKVVPSHASMLWSHAVVAGDGVQQLYVGREVECQNMARKFAGAFLDGAFAFHSMAAAPTAQAAPALEAPAAPEIIDIGDDGQLRMDPDIPCAWQLFRGDSHLRYLDKFESNFVNSAIRAALAAAPQAPAEAQEPAANLHDDGYWTPTKTEAGRALNERLMRAGSPRIPVYTHPAPQAPAAPSAGMTPRDKATQDQIASVMLQHGTAEQQRQALDYASGTAPVAGQGRFKGDKEWGSCSVEHVRMVLADPSYTADGYEVRYLYTAPQAAPAAPAVDACDTALLDAMAAESMDLRCFDIPTGQGDADVGWRVIQHHMSEPTERVVSEVYKDDPRSAIRAAIARLERDPYCTGPLHEEDAGLAAQAAAKGDQPLPRS